MDERDTRLLPYLDTEVAWARNRPTWQQTPIPALGDEVFYRHETWGDATRAEVLAVQPVDDMSDLNLWTVQRGPNGKPQLLEGRYVVRQSADPWPLLTLHTIFGRCETREARMRGSAGWLPLDWETRFRPVPDVIVVRGDR